jgi:hypothetical protein
MAPNISQRTLTWRTPLADGGKKKYASPVLSSPVLGTKSNCGAPLPL